MRMTRSGISSGPWAGMAGSAVAKLADLTSEGVLFADTFDGQDISAEHGRPVRLAATERPGFWEKAGYHMRGDPWKEERYRD